MANEAFHGKTGSVDFGGAWTNVLSWTVDLVAEVHDSTAMHATNDGRTREVGLKSGTATIETLWAVGDLPQADVQVAAATLKLYRVGTTASNGYYTGTAILESWDQDEPVDDLVKITYNFRFTSAVTLAVA